MNLNENEILNGNQNMVSPDASVQNLQMPMENSNISIQNQQMGNIPNGVCVELKMIDELVRKGIIDSQQGLNMLCERVIDAQKKCSQENVKKYDLDSDEFFKNPEYKLVLDYLKGTNTDFDAGDISQITGLIKGIENQAIEKYLKNLEYMDNLKAENMLAKQRLSNNAKKEGADFSAPIFTREMIGKMNGTEFVKNERAIIEQAKRGLIR